MSNDTADGTVETPNVEDLQAQLKKAEAKIVDLKKSSKETTSEVTTEVEVKADTTVDTSNFMTREDFEKDNFFKSNPNLVEHKDTIEEYVSKGYSLDDAKIVVLNKDETIQNRNNAKISNFTSGDTGVVIPSYTKDELGNMSQSEYNKVKALEEKGKVTITT